MDQITTSLQENSLPLITFTEKKQQRLKEKIYAPLEPKTQRILDKLKKRLDHLDQQITTDRLEDSLSKIKYWLSRHIAQRVPVDKGEASLFSEGRSAAKMSRRIEELRERLRNDLQPSFSTHQELKGRVTKTS